MCWVFRFSEGGGELERREVIEGTLHEQGV